MGSGEGVCYAIPEGGQVGKGPDPGPVREGHEHYRHYAAWLLHHQGRRVKVTPRVVVQGDFRVHWRRGRRRIYGPDRRWRGS